MANAEHLDILRAGVDVWNSWRERNPNIRPDFSYSDLCQAKLKGVHLAGADLTRTELIRADLEDANLSGAILEKVIAMKASFHRANLEGANLFKSCLDQSVWTFAKVQNANAIEAVLTDAHCFSADFSGCNFVRANLERADFSYASLKGSSLFCASLKGAVLNQANLTGANLFGADLEAAQLVETNLTNAIIKSCKVFGVSTWGIELTGAIQQDLEITRTDWGEPYITIDQIEIAQLIHLLLHNAKIRDVIDTVAKKVVLILGRFTPERKVILDAVKEALRDRDYIPVLFDFEKPRERDITETVVTLAHLSRFVIADISEARSIPQELHSIVPHLPSVPIQPILCASCTEYGMFEHFKRYPWVLKEQIYESSEDLIKLFDEKIIEPVECKLRKQEIAR